MSAQTASQLLPLHALLADLVPHGSRVLDLGCGDGRMLQSLIQNKNCTGYGVEFTDAGVQGCIQRGVPVLQLNLEDGLDIFDDASFDVVLQINTLQHLRNAEVMLRETARVGKMGVVAFPNFAHWPNRMAVLRGRMPVTKALPYEWYDTPNIRVGTFADFAVLAARCGLTVSDAFGVLGNAEHCKAVRTFPNLMANTAVFTLRG